MGPSIVRTPSQETHLGHPDVEWHTLFSNTNVRMENRTCEVRTGTRPGMGEDHITVAAQPPPPTARMIRSAAVGLFSKIGYEAASMRQIAAAVGVNPASLHNHYSSKDE